jgi:predicted 3-demethylubiquinone-9 3-methyltransferase (glyoxalase superfamily)
MDGSHSWILNPITRRYPARAMPQFITFLTFNNQAEEAARFYTSIFPNSRITQITHYPDLGASFPFKAGTVMTVSFVLDGREFVALNGGPNFPFSQGISISVQCQTQEEVDRYWNRLLEGGGTAHACGWLSDRFGVPWQINPVILMQALSHTDPEKVKKAMSAMMTMVKIDAEQIQQALAN